MPKHPPPMRPLAVSIVVDRLRVIIPAAVLIAIVVALSPSVAVLLLPRQPAPAQRAPTEAVPAWAVTMGPSAFAALAQEAIRALPSPIEGQRLPPACDPDLEREIKGACWVPVDVERCPPGKAYVNDDGPKPDGKCYARAMRAARMPTSGEVHHAGVAEP